MASLFETLFGQENKRDGPMTGILMRSVCVHAWMHRHRVGRLEHLVDGLVDMIDVRNALDTRGIHHADVAAVLTQLREDVPRRDDGDPDEEPPLDPALGALARAATTNGVRSTQRLIEAVAATLPPELGFVRRPLSGAASELGATFDAALSSTKRSGAAGEHVGLTFEAWDANLKTCVGLMQTLADKHGGWEMWPGSLFTSVLAYKPFFAYFKDRGHDPVVLMQEVVADMPEPTWPVRPRPPSLVPTIGPSLFALFLRAERYAAQDATDVRLRHLLLALHDEPMFAKWIDRLAS